MIRTSVRFAAPSVADAFRSTLVFPQARRSAFAMRLLITPTPCHGKRGASLGESHRPATP